MRCIYFHEIIFGLHSKEYKNVITITRRDHIHFKDKMLSTICICKNKCIYPLFTASSEKS